MKLTGYSLCVAVILSLCAGLSNAPAQTLYWNKTTANLVWATGSNANWTTTPAGTTYQLWTAGYDAEIVTTNPTITMGGSGITAGSLTVDNGAIFTAGSTTSMLSITGSTTTGTSGSGNFSMSDNATNNAALRISFQDTTVGHTGYNGTITVNAFTSANSYLQLGADNKLATPAALTGTGVNTKIVLNGGVLSIGGGIAGTSATIGELSGAGTVQVGNVFSTNGGTRNLIVDQATSTVFTGVFGSTTTAQSTSVLAVTKTGSGTLTINGTGSSGFAGTSTVQSGKLYLNGTFGNATSGSGNVNQGGFSVQSGATFGLNGAFNLGGTNAATFDDGAIFDPGAVTFDGAGTTTSKGLIFSGNATIEFTLGTSADMVTLVDGSMNGQASGGIGSIGFNFLNAGDVQVGTTYDLIGFGGTSAGIALNTFGLSSTSLTNGWTGTFGYGGDGNLLQFTVTSVPEVNSVSLVLFALVLIGVAHRRKVVVA